jgi:hypothetical protein
MSFEPKILFNPKSEQTEFMYDHQVYVFQPGEKKLMDGTVADHALRFANSGLKEYVPETDDKLVSSTDVAYDKMPWREVVSLASKRGLINKDNFGVTKKELLRLLAESDAQQGN